MRSFLLLAAIISASAAFDNDTLLVANQRAKKVLPVFQVVKFPNIDCGAASGRNGTCYTSSECNTKAGTASGSCASGFGVCCLFVLSCGGVTSQNSSYLVQSDVTSVQSPCTYTICPTSNSICRIRFDFTTFVLSPPFTTTSGGAAVAINGAALGDCNTDSFSITSSGNKGSPVICGINSGQHMILDSTSSCLKANFNIGSSSLSTTRSWDIKVTQYTCDAQNLGGPPDCLQYFTGKTNTISSFNFQTAAVAANTAQHLSNQAYTICIRRESTFCSICYALATPGSFGLSTSAITTAQGQVDAGCSTDYLIIPGGTSAPIPAISYIPLASRFCGRFLATTQGSAAAAQVCTRQIPFMLTFKTDGDEFTSIAGATMANFNELSELPSGTVGFSIVYTQSTC